jgi:multiple sugar transport system substrate-binding protein
MSKSTARRKTVRSNRVHEVGTRATGQSDMSRRRLLKAGGAAALLGGAAPRLLGSRRARANQRTLKILKWRHGVPTYDEWFIGTYIKNWSAENDTEVIVDNVGYAEVKNQAMVETERQQGHDLVMFLTPGAPYEAQVIDHREIYEECERRYGKVAEFGVKSTHNSRTNKHFALALGYQPAVITYRKDLWDAVGAAPDTWDDILTGGRRIKLLNDKPVGFSLAAETNCEWTLRAIMYCFGSAEQDDGGHPALNSRATLEAIKYVKALYEEAMPPEVLTWDVLSNDQFVLNGDGCLTLDTLSPIRGGERLGLTIADDIRLARMPEGPARRLAPAWGLVTAFIWKFAENIEGAKRFLVDYVGNSREALTASGFQSMPIWPGTVPDLAAVVAADPAGGAESNYSLLKDAITWTTNIGHPGLTNAWVAEVFDLGLISSMFARAASGQRTPEEALAEADSELRRIFQKR